MQLGGGWRFSEPRVHAERVTDPESLGELVGRCPETRPHVDHRLVPAELLLVHVGRDQRRGHRLGRRPNSEPSRRSHPSPRLEAAVAEGRRMEHLVCAHHRHRGADQPEPVEGRLDQPVERGPVGDRRLRLGTGDCRRHGHGTGGQSGGDGALEQRPARQSGPGCGFGRWHTAEWVHDTSGRGGPAQAPPAGTTIPARPVASRRMQWSEREPALTRSVPSPHAGPDPASSLRFSRA
jgi:hypothetical protein